MGILWVLIPLSFCLLGFAIWAFFWAVDNDQWEGLDQASYTALDLEPQSPKHQGDPVHRDHD